MARNGTPKALSAETTRRQARIADILSGRLGEVVSLTYVKRNGETSSGTGEVLFFNGQPGFDTGAVTLDTTETKGRHSSVNLHNVLTIDGEPILL